MSLDHTRIEELIAVRSLGALDGSDADDLAQMMADHGPTCERCRELENGFAEVAGRLAFALDPTPVDPGMADRILAQPRPVASVPATQAARPSFPAAPSPTPDADELGARREVRTRGRTWTALIGVAAAVAVLVAVVVAVQPGGTLKVAAGPSQRIVRFDGEDDVGRLAMAYTPGETGVIFWGSDLPDPGPDRVYEIWMIDDDEPVAGGCVVPLDGRIALYVEADVGTTDLMAITVEPSECPSAPTAAPVFTAPLA